MGLIVSILVCFAASGVGALFTTPNIEGWYQTLESPAGTPPNWIFGPVWSLLYLLMAISAWWIWKEKGFREAQRPLTIFAVQLTLNVLWSILFFGFQSPGVALLEIILLWIMILTTIVTFSRIAKVAGLLLIPYLLWVSFATYLNYGFWSLNA